MPPHWNKVASIKRWLDYGIYDAVIWLDIDTIFNDFSTNIYDIFDDTEGVRHQGNPAFILFRHGDVSRCVVDNWWSFGTSPGCRYFKYPENHMGQVRCVFKCKTQGKIRSTTHLNMPKTRRLKI